MLGYALVRGTADGWLDAATVFTVRLTPQERACLTIAGLKSLDDDTRIKIAEAAVGGAGAPLPAFLDVMGNAAIWAEAATGREHEAYALAAFRAMPAHRQRAFLQHVEGRS